MLHIKINSHSLTKRSDLSPPSKTKVDLIDEMSWDVFLYRPEKWSFLTVPKLDYSSLAVGWCDRSPSSHCWPLLHHISISVTPKAFRHRWMLRRMNRGSKQKGVMIDCVLVKLAQKFDQPVHHQHHHHHHHHHHHSFGYLSSQHTSIAFICILCKWSEKAWILFKPRTILNHFRGSLKLTFSYEQFSEWPALFLHHL